MRPRPIPQVCPHVTTDRPVLKTGLSHLDGLWGQVPSGLGKVKPCQPCLRGAWHTVGTKYHYPELLGLAAGGHTQNILRELVLRKLCSAQGWWGLSMSSGSIQVWQVPMCSGMGVTESNSGMEDKKTRMTPGNNEFSLSS